MSLHELSSRYMEAEALRMLQEDSDTDEPNDEEEDMPKDDLVAQVMRIV